MLRVLASLWNIGESIAEFLFWRDDWHRTWSPVSYWLAVFTGLGLIIVGIMYGQILWEHVQGFVGGGSSQR
jgi:hypothetical protein